MVKEHATLMDCALAIPSSRAQIAIYLHALMLQIRGHALLVSALVMMDSQVRVSMVVMIHKELLIQ